MKLIKELLKEEKRLNFDNRHLHYWGKGYDKKNKVIKGGGIYSNNWSREDIALAVDEIKKTAEFRKVEEVMPFVSTPKELANGTLSFKSDVGTVLYPNDKSVDTVKVYLGGQIRTQSNSRSTSRAITRVPSPKPHMVAGDPIKSAVGAYKGALEAVRIRYDKIKAKKDKRESIDEAQNLRGWSIVDKSFVTKGSDPTQVTKIDLLKAGLKVTIEEFFGDWTVSDNRGFVSKRDLKMAQVDQLLKEYGAPSLKQLFKEIEPEDYSDDPMGNLEP